MPPQTIPCPTCGTQLGEIRLRNGRAFLLHGRAYIRAGIVACPDCGREFHWNGETHGRQLEQAVDKRLVGLSA